MQQLLLYQNSSDLLVAISAGNLCKRPITMAAPATSPKTVAEEFFPPRTQPTQAQIDAVRSLPLSPSLTIK